MCKNAVTGFVTENELLRAYANSSSGMYAETEDGTLSSTVLAGIVFTSALENNGTQFPSSIEVAVRTWCKTFLIRLWSCKQNNYLPVYSTVWGFPPPYGVSLACLENALVSAWNRRGSLKFCIPLSSHLVLGRRTKRRQVNQVLNISDNTNLLK